MKQIGRGGLVMTRDDEPIYIMKNDEVYASYDGRFLTVSDYSRNGIALTRTEALALADAIKRHFEKE